MFRNGTGIGYSQHDYIQPGNCGVTGCVFGFIYELTPTAHYTETLFKNRREIYKERPYCYQIIYFYKRIVDR